MYVDAKTFCEKFVVLFCSLSGRKYFTVLCKRSTYNNKPSCKGNFRNVKKFFFVFHSRNVEKNHFPDITLHNINFSFFGCYSHVSLHMYLCVARYTKKTLVEKS